MAEETIQGNTAPAPAAAPIAPVEPVVAPAPQPAPTAIESRDRTREQFEKLLESNRRLYETNALLQREIEQSRTPAPRSVQQPASQQVNPNDFVERDPITGEAYINEARLRSRLEEANTKVARLEQTVQSIAKTAEEREIERQEKETYSAHPELNPNSKQFDASFNRNVRSILTDSFYNTEEYGGRPLSFKEAADFVRAQFPKQQPTAPTGQEPAAAEAQARAAQVQAQKEQGSAQAVSQPRGQQAAISDEQELEDLRYRTRYLNDDWALARRIVNTDHVVRDEDVS